MWQGTKAGEEGGKGTSAETGPTKNGKTLLIPRGANRWAVALR